MDFRGGKMMETNEDHSFPMNIVPKEERLDFEEYYGSFCDEMYKQEEKKAGETSRRGRTRSLTKKSADKVDIKAKLERSRQSARECRARKKLRYQYLEEIISETEKAIVALRREMDCLRLWGKEMDEGRIPPALMDYRQACIDRKILVEPFRMHNTDILMEESQQEPEVLRHVHTVASSPASSGIASASTSAGTGVTTMAFSPTGGQLSAFASMMLSPSSLTHNISPS